MVIWTYVENVSLSMKYNGVRLTGLIFCFTAEKKKSETSSKCVLLLCGCGCFLYVQLQKLSMKLEHTMEFLIRMTERNFAISRTKKMNR